MKETNSNNLEKNKIIRVSTVPMSLDILVEGQLKFLSEYYEVVGVSSPGEALEKVSLREGIRMVAVQMERKISLFKDFISLMKLIIVFYKEKPMIVHSMTPKAGLLSMIAAKLVGVSIRIHTFTGLVFPTTTGFKKKILIAMDRLLCACATNVIPEGEGVKRDLINYKITRKTLSVLANGNVNGIDCDYFSVEAMTGKRNELRERLGFTSDDFVFISIGRMVKDKGINELINAFRQIMTPCTKLLMLGNFENNLDAVLPETEQFIRENSNVKYVGFQSDIRPFLYLADVFVFPSYREGFPNVVMQAGAMGLPSIVTDINGSNEIIVDGWNGIIIPSKDVDSLINAMKLMINNVEKRKQLSTNARQMICSRYERDLVWNSLLTEYKSLEKNV